MDFLDILKDMVEGIPGGYAATMMGTDGIAVRNYVRSGLDCDIETIGVEYVRILGEIEKVSRTLELGDVEEVVIGLDGNTVLLRPVPPDYFLALVVDGDAILGKARYVLKMAARDVCRELKR